jgi:hypothetical protein
LICAAAYAAPNPLSIFTTVTPDPQEFSIPSNAAYSAEARAITDARRDGNHWLADQASDGAGQGAFHAGDHDDDGAGLQLLANVEQSVNTSDSDVGDADNSIAEEFQCDRGFVRYG